VNFLFDQKTILVKRFTPHDQGVAAILSCPLI